MIKSEWGSSSRELTRTGPERVFCSDDNVLYFDSRSDTQIGQNLSNEVLKIYVFRCTYIFQKFHNKMENSSYYRHSEVFIREHTITCNLL